MTASATYLLLAASVMAVSQGASIPCQLFAINGPLCPFISCSATDVSVTCLYRNVTSLVFAEPKWYLDGQPIVPTSVSRYNNTVWQMKYNYSSLCPGEYVFYGKERENTDVETCCGATPEVSITLTVTAEKRKEDVSHSGEVSPSGSETSNQTDPNGNEGSVQPPTGNEQPDEEDEQDTVVLQLGKTMKDLVLWIVKIVNGAKEEN